VVGLRVADIDARRAGFAARHDLQSGQFKSVQ
jgi:hypothetical protein